MRTVHHQGGPVIEPLEPLPTLTAGQVRAILESVRCRDDPEDSPDESP
jgi:hypothetical protein